MKLPKLLFFYSCILSLIVTSCSAQRTTGLGPQSKNIPKTETAIKKESNLVFNDPERSFRGVWIATVANIDWPKNSSDTYEKMQKDYIDLLVFYKKIKFNAQKN